RISIGLAKSFLENLYAIFGSRRRKNKGSAANPKCALQLNDFAFAIRFGKALDLGQTAEPGMRMLVAFWSFHDRMNLHQVFFKPLAALRQASLGPRGSPMDCPTPQTRMELATAVGSNELRVFQTKHIGEQATFIVGREANRLRPDP